MEHAGMVRMFKALEDTGLRGFLEGTTIALESAVTEFFSNARVIAGTIVSTVSGKKLVVTEEIFSRTLKLPTEGMQNLFGIPNETISEMRTRFSATTVPFKSYGKKNDLLFEYRLLHDIVAKSLYAKAGCFDKVTCEKFELMVAISAGISVNWSRILFQRLLGIVQNTRKQSQGYTVQISMLLELLVQADLGTSTKLHAKKVLTSKQVENYIKINQGPTQTEDTASNTEGEPSHHTHQVPPEITKYLADATKQNVPNPTKRKHKDSCPLMQRQRRTTQISESSDSLPLPLLLKRMRTQRQSEHDEHHDHNFTTANVDHFHKIAPTEGEGTVAGDEQRDPGLQDPMTMDINLSYQGISEVNPEEGLNSDARKEHARQSGPDLFADARNGSSDDPIPTVPNADEANVADNEQMNNGSEEPENIFPTTVALLVCVSLFARSSLAEGHESGFVQELYKSKPSSEILPAVEEGET
ncbi:hypothetical protein F511_08673 [Dorcoceras hygrometricum]|uniref:Dystroglycan-like n=1 Tax=Dorcoceras hygrometricum TaxID=472368 RepID=A0A2Z7AW67_9LAMI|nr:hypothetical protein F511_08673 [Dorcoceras hygrometricum]